VGHSLGGYVALALASGTYGVHPTAALSIGAKLVFSDADRARGAELAAKPVKWFATRVEAEERYRLVSGLPETLFPDAECIERGVREGEGGFRIATDPAALGITVPGFASLLATTRCPVRIARGEHDALVSREECRALGRNVAELPALGHNAHVENAALVAGLVEELLGA
jgi:pimeloyl-ACP methyl ester carboxylesterase